MPRTPVRLTMLHVTISLVGLTGTAQGQLAEPVDGPIIFGWGAVYPIDAVDYVTPIDREYRVLFDVKTGPDRADVLSPELNTVARFLNMHAQAGVDATAMHVAVILHGSAGKYALAHGPYHARFGVENPNLDLIAALADAGVVFYLCGQTAIHREFPPEELAPPIQLALSAMTALVTLQVDGYVLGGT